MRYETRLARFYDKLHDQVNDFWAKTSPEDETRVMDIAEALAYTLGSVMGTLRNVDDETMRVLRAVQIASWVKRGEEEEKLAYLKSTAVSEAESLVR